MRLVFLVCIALLVCAFPLRAAVDIAPRGKPPVRIEDVYQRKGVPYVAIEDAIDAVGLSGHWNSIEHIFRIKTRRGWAEISPASSQMKLAGDYYPLQDKPRFIDGRLRVTESFILNQLPLLVGRPIYFRNLDPELETPVDEGANPFERFFAFLLDKKAAENGPLIRAVAIDPGHGGLDTGVIGADGYKEKELNLKVAEKLARQLKMKFGIPIYLSRDGDYELSVEQRLQPLSHDDVDLWLLLHAQSSFSSQPHGVTLFVRPEPQGLQPESAEAQQPEDSPSLMLAKALVAALREAGIAVNGIYPSSLLSLGRGDLPTVQVELGYFSNPQDLKALQQPEQQNRVVQALYQGIRRYAEMKKEKQNEVSQ